jgi:purine-binding chemotaxis protein CheW
MPLDLLDRSTHASASHDATPRMFVALTVAGQVCGLPVLSVRDVLAAPAIAPIPLAPPEVAGSLNLRGRIVTAIDLRRRLRLSPAPPGAARMAVVTEQEGELYALLVDEVNEVVSVASTQIEAPPPTLPPAWAAHCTCLCRLQDTLMAVLDVARVLAIGAEG